MDVFNQSFEILDKMFMDFFIMDLDFNIICIKPNTAAALGYDQEDLNNKTLQDVVIEKNYSAGSSSLMFSASRGPLRFAEERRDLLPDDQG